MSPASQGALEVERYIGSCLITSNCCKQDQHQQQQQQQQQHNNRTTSKHNQFWAGGAPLMQQQQQQHNRVPLSRLAVHTQGAPLILSSQRYHNSRHSKQQPPPPPPLFNNISRPPPTPAPSQQQQQRITNNNRLGEVKKTVKANETNVNGTNIDSLSIASDESSGSNNSENSLPRIIKPRKRRKKDRKPALAAPANTPKDNNKPSNQDDNSVLVLVQAAPNALSQQPEQRLKSNYSSYDNAPRYPNDNGNYYRRSMPNNNNNNRLQQTKSQEVIDTRQQQQQQRFGHRHLQVKVLDDNRNVILPVPLCQSAKVSNYPRQQCSRFLHAQDLNDECAGLCQCHCCDPATLIWDVSDQQQHPPGAYQNPGQYMSAQQGMLEVANHRRHQQQHHHHNNQHQQQRYAQVPVFLRPIICQEHLELFDVADNPCLRLRPASTDRVDGSSALLRRSWSDPSSYFSDEIVPNRDVGVIGDRGQSGGESTSKSKNPWRGDALSVGSSSPTNSCDSGAGSPGLQAPLEVSTEIVTSANGHRDLEIKFFSSSPPSSEQSPRAFGAAFHDDNDSEEFSDIWSYHESKLQQDFRTLLQAGED